PSAGTFAAPATPGRVAVPPAPTPIHAGRTRRGRCCASSLSTRFRTRGLVVLRRVSEFRIRFEPQNCWSRISAAADGGFYLAQGCRWLLDDRAPRRLTLGRRTRQLCRSSLPMCADGVSRL